ncbi:MAG: ABC transporter ATP-binding protein [Euryarchaeota archaeon]|nr:ABC transporter ATP-binding protein [Euryarchaeota archaeon]
MSDAIILARELSKWYGKVIGLNSFNIEIGKGITGIVGPNGSGKSTFFKLMIGSIKPNVGELVVMGHRPWRDPSYLREVGFCPDYDFLPSDTTGRDYLRFSGGMQGMEGAKLSTRVDELLKLVGMTRDADRNIGGYSKGMKQRIKIAGSLVHDPPMLLLDEPFSGTDPMVRRDLMDLVKSLHHEHGHDVIISSHVLHDVERLTNSVGLIYRGRAVATGEISEIRGLMSKYPHRIIIEGKGLMELAKQLIDRPYTVSLHLAPDRSSMTAEVSMPEDFFNEMPDLVQRSGSELTQMRSLDDDLESVFKYLAGD